MLLIIACIVCVSIGGGEGSAPSADGKQMTEKEKSDYAFNLGMSILFAVIVGITFSLNTISVEQTLRAGCNINQANYDGNLFMFLFLLPFFLVVWFSDDNPITWRDIGFGTAVFICVTVGVVFLSLGLEVGHAGPVQAIYGQATTFQAVVTAIITQKLPTGLQIGGVVCGMLGVIVIMCQNKDDD